MVRTERVDTNVCRLQPAHWRTEQGRRVQRPIELQQLHAISFRVLLHLDHHLFPVGLSRSVVLRRLLRLLVAAVAPNLVSLLEESSFFSVAFPLSFPDYLLCRWVAFPDPIDSASPPSPSSRSREFSVFFSASPSTSSLRSVLFSVSFVAEYPSWSPSALVTLPVDYPWESPPWP